MKKILVLAAALCFGFTACTTAADDDSGADSSSSDAASGDAIKVGFTNTDAGAIGFPGYTKATELAIKYINEDLGGIDGHPLELVTCSQSGDQASAAKCGQELANDDSLTAIVTGYLFSGGPFYDATASKNRTIVGGVPITQADYAAQKAWFYSSGSVGQIGSGALYLANDLGVKSLGVVYVDDPGGAGAAAFDLVKSILADSDVAITGVPVATGATDYAPALSAAGDVEAFIGLTDPAGCINFANAYSQLDLSAIVMASSACQGDEILAAVGPKMDGYYMYQPGPIPLLGRGVDDDLDTYLDAIDKYGIVESPSSDSGVVAFGIMTAVANQMKAIGYDNLTPGSFDDSIESFEGPVPGVASQLSCPGKIQPNVCTSEGRIFKFIEGGTKVEDVLDGKPIVVDEFYQG